MDAGITYSFCYPIGLYINQSKRIKSANLNDGAGNFYLKPNGALLILDNTAVVCESSLISSYSEIRIGIQSGPMLILNGNLNSQFNPASVNRNYRSGVGISENLSGEKYLIFCCSKNPVTFYEFAILFREKFHCKNALCLSSGNPIMNTPFIPNNSDNAPEIFCRYIYLDLD